MADAGGKSSPPATPEAELSRIRHAVDDGDTDLGELGFWRLVDAVKRDPALAMRLAAEIGEIDAEAFRRRTAVRLPVWLGNAVLSGGLVLGAALLAWAAVSDDPGQAAVGLMAAGGVLSVSVHDLAHWAVGRLEGIRFSSYFFSRPLLQPGLKTDYATYLRASPQGRARMHAAGAVATKVAPFVSLAVWPATDAPAWAALVVLGYGLVQIVTDVLWSTKKSDWKRYARERRIAGEVTRASYTGG